MSTMASIDLKWSPDPMVFRDAIMEVDAALSHPEVAMALAGQEVLADIRERFMTETAPDGTPWQDWSEKYEEFALAFPNMGILRQTGALFEAATSEEALIVSGDSLFYDMNALPEYGEWHQTGLPDRTMKGGKPNPLPQRPFAGLSEQARTTIFVVFKEWFDGAIALFSTATGRVGMRHQMRGAGGRFMTRSTPLPVLRRR